MYGNKIVLNNISFSVTENTTVAILGPSGCGKSTLFNILAGLEKPDSGQILFDGIENSNPTKNVSYMLQNDLLLPHKTIIQNVTLPLILSGVKKNVAEKKAKKLFDSFLISGSENKFPHELSGGMRQRAAFLRTYLREKNIILLDEPFSALDNLTKSSMHSWYLNITKSLNITTLIITHDIDEAILLADSIFVMSPNSHNFTNCINVNNNNKDMNFLFSPEFICLKKEILSILSQFSSR